jgi:hypothetical protein
MQDGPLFLRLHSWLDQCITSLTIQWTGEIALATWNLSWTTTEAQLFDLSATRVWQRAGTSKELSNETIDT